MQIKHFTAPQKMPNFQFSRRAKWPWQDKILGAPQRGKKIIITQSKPHLVIISIKLFTCQSFRHNYFSREIEWAVREVPGNIHATPTEGIGFSQGKGGSV